MTSPATILAAEIQNDPLALGYAGFLPGAPGEVCEMLNRKTQTMHKSKMISFRGLYASYGVGPVMAPSILAKLRAGAANNQVLFDAKEMIYSTEGMDIGEASSLALIDQLTPGVFTADEAAALKQISLQPASRAEVLGLPVVTIDMLREAGVI